MSIFSFPMSFQIFSRISKSCIMFLKKYVFTVCTPNLESLLVCCIFKIFAANLHIWRPTLAFANLGEAPCRDGRNLRKRCKSKQKQHKFLTMTGWCWSGMLTGNSSTIGKQTSPYHVVELQTVMFITFAPRLCLLILHTVCQHSRFWEVT